MVGLIVLLAQNEMKGKIFKNMRLADPPPYSLTVCICVIVHVDCMTDDNLWRSSREQRTRNEF